MLYISHLAWRLAIPHLPLRDVRNTHFQTVYQNEYTALYAYTTRYTIFQNPSAPIRLYLQRYI